MNKIKFLLPVLAFFFLNSCGLHEVMEKANKIQEIAFKNCDCDEVRLLNYSEENFRSSAYLEIIGADGESKREVATKINNALKEAITDYCKIDLMTLDFINKGQHHTITIRYCKLDN